MTRSSSTSATVFKRLAFALLVLAAALPARPGTTTPLSEALDRVGRDVEDFWNYFPSVTCTEALAQSRLGEKGKVLFRHYSTYDYLILLQASGTDVTVDESRVERNRKGSKGKASLLVSNGFSILALIFHPVYRSRYEFRELSDDSLDGRRLRRIGFRQITTDHGPSVLLLRDREYPLEWSGTAWIDPDSFDVVRIHTGLKNPMEEIGLLCLEADVSYTKVPFSGGSAYWLPSRAVIEAETKRQHWRNTHVFSNYRRFNVETVVKTPSPQ